jgi:hypothetical protein
MIYANNIPIIGARKIKAPIFKITPVCTTFHPAYAIAAPEKPPTRVCDELEGMPRNHVVRFQMMAARMPDNITRSVIAEVSTVFEMVSATLS